MNYPFIRYNGKTITFADSPVHRQLDVSVPRTVAVALSGRTESLTAPRVDVQVRTRFQRIESATLLAAYENWHQWAGQGKPFQFAFDSSKTIFTELSTAQTMGDSVIGLESVTDITVGDAYVLMDGPQYQVVTVSAVGTTNVTIGSTLDYDFGLGSVFRDKYFFNATLRNPSAPYPIRINEAGQTNPPSRFDLDLIFDEVPIRHGLAAYWRMEESATTRFDALGYNDLLDIATVTATTGPSGLGTCAQFTSANSEYLETGIIDVSNPLRLGVDDDFTLTAWVYLDSVGANREVIGQRGESPANTNGWLVQYNNVDTAFVFRYPQTGAGVNALALGAPSLATWYFIVVWRNRRAGTLHIQVNNGTVNSAAESGTPVVLTTPVRIGAAKNTAGAAVNFMNGRIDEVAIWKRVLGVDTKTYLYKAGAGRPFSTQDPHFHE